MAKKEVKKVKKNKKTIGKTPAHYDSEVVRIVKIAVSIIITFAIVYFITEFINEQRNKADKQEVEIQNVEILMGETFEKKDSEYIIVYYDFEDKMYSELYSMLVENYNSVKSDIPMYKVDLSTNFSKKYMAGDEEVSNINPTSLSNLKVKGDTLIRIKDKTVIKYVEGKDNIKNYINEIIK
ncbi:MAG: hypothetical protein IJO43_03085 [Bacilli bacterium]|nr:hypothetical protein [Bacilli bacterium]